MYFGQYMYPKSVEMPTLADRKYHPSYPPMITIGLYILFKTLEVTGIVPDIYHQRGLQLLIVIWLNHIFHFILALSLCLLAFVVTRRLGFDALNSALIAITPAIVLFHNAGSLYWYNHLFIAPVIIVPLFTTYTLLELLRHTDPSPRVRKVIKIGQPLLMFCGVYMGWLFPFVITTVYIVRLMMKEIVLPWTKPLIWLKQSFLFFWPAFLALGIWIYTIVLYQQNVITNNFLDTPTSSMGNTTTHNFLHKLGIIDFQGNLAIFEQKLFWFKRAFYEHITHDYGLIAFFLIFITLYLAINSRRRANTNIASFSYLLLLIPSIVYGLILTVDDANHHFTSVKYAPALAIVFVIAPILILDIKNKDPLMPVMKLANGKSIALATIISVASSSLWAYTKIYSENKVTKLFTSPQYHHLAIGDFVRKNTNYHDVVFSNDYFFQHPAYFIYSFFTIKAMHFADNLDVIYRKTKHINEEFTVKIFYYQRSHREIDQLKTFLESQQLVVDNIVNPALGGLLAVNGNNLISWYKDAYCQELPNKCED